MVIAVHKFHFRLAIKWISNKVWQKYSMFSATRPTLYLGKIILLVLSRSKAFYWVSNSTRLNVEHHRTIPHFSHAVKNVFQSSCSWSINRSRWYTTLATRSQDLAPLPPFICVGTWKTCFKVKNWNTRWISSSLIENAICSKYCPKQPMKAQCSIHRCTEPSTSPETIKSAIKFPVSTFRVF